MKPKNTYFQLTKILTVAGLLVVVVGCAANLFGYAGDRDFIHSPLDYAYYLRLVILLGGGFAAGYFLSPKTSSGNIYDRLFAGVVYSAVAMSLYVLVDLARLGAQYLIGGAAYPWSGLIFSSMPLVGLFVALAIAWMTQRLRRRTEPSRSAWGIILAAFFLYQAFYLASDIYYSWFKNTGTSAWSIALSLLTLPVIVAAVAYYVLNGVKSRYVRLTRAVLIGLLYSMLTSSLWELRTDPSMAVTNNFYILVTGLVLAFAIIVIWQARLASKITNGR